MYISQLVDNCANTLEPKYTCNNIPFYKMYTESVILRWARKKRKRKKKKEKNKQTTKKQQQQQQKNTQKKHKKPTQKTTTKNKNNKKATKKKKKTTTNKQKLFINTLQHKLNRAIKKRRVSSKYSYTGNVIRYENTPIQIYTENFTTKKWKFSDKNSDIFHTSAQNIDCGYSLEPPRRGGSNEYPQSMFWAETRKIMYTLANPSLTI